MSSSTIVFSIRTSKELVQWIGALARVRGVDRQDVVIAGMKCMQDTASEQEKELVDRLLTINAESEAA